MAAQRAVCTLSNCCFNVLGVCSDNRSIRYLADRPDVLWEGGRARMKKKKEKKERHTFYVRLDEVRMAAASTRPVSSPPFLIQLLSRFNMLLDCC